MRVFATCLATETNSFSPMLTGLDDFTIVRQENPKTPGTGHMLECLKQQSINRDDDLFYGLSAFAQPSGITVRSTYERLRDEILNDLKTIHLRVPSQSYIDYV